MCHSGVSLFPRPCFVCLFSFGHVVLFPVYISEWIDFEGLGESLQEISNRANLVKYLIPRLKNDKNGRAPSLILCKTPLT